MEKRYQGTLFIFTILWTLAKDPIGLFINYVGKIFRKTSISYHLIPTHITWSVLEYFVPIKGGFSNNIVETLS